METPEEILHRVWRRFWPLQTKVIRRHGSSLYGLWHWRKECSFFPEDRAVGCSERAKLERMYCKECMVLETLTPTEDSRSRRKPEAAAVA